MGGAVRRILRAGLPSLQPLNMGRFPESSVTKRANANELLGTQIKFIPRRNVAQNLPCGRCWATSVTLARPPKSGPAPFFAAPNPQE